jgi:hypothetical protein
MSAPFRKFVVTEDGGNYGRFEVCIARGKDERLWTAKRYEREKLNREIRQFIEDAINAALERAAIARKGEK